MIAKDGMRGAERLVAQGEASLDDLRAAIKENRDALQAFTDGVVALECGDAELTWGRLSQIYAAIQHLNDSTEALKNCAI